MFSPVVPAAASASVNRKASTRALKEENGAPSTSGSAASTSSSPTRHKSMRFFRRTSSRRSYGGGGGSGGGGSGSSSSSGSSGSIKREVPAHLLKFLQKTPEQQARVDAVKLILADEPGARQEMSLDVVYDWMLQNCKQHSNNIFGSAPEYIRREICRQMRLIKCAANQLLIRQGDTGDRCYIVIDGLVDVYIKKKETLVSPDSVGGSGSGGSGSAGSGEDRASPVRSSRRPSVDTTGGALAVPNPKDYGDMVANLGPGAMFGEVVLLNPTARRNATITASQFADTCELICLERADYIRLVRGASMEASHYNQAEILDQMYLFQGWEKHDKMKLVSGMRSMRFVSNEYLYRAGTDARWMFVISSGEVVERVNWSVGRPVPANGAGVSLLSSGSNSASSSAHAASLPSIGAFSSSSSSSSAMLPSPATSSSTSSSSASAYAYAGTPAGGADVPEKKVNVDLMLVGAGDVAGEFPFVRARWSAAFDLKAVSDVHALAIDRRVFETMILHARPESQRGAPTTLLKLQQLTREREDWRQQRLACGTAYPSAHISITWQLMRMSNLRCPRCGARGHLATDTARCGNPSPRRRERTVRGSSQVARLLPLLAPSPSPVSPKKASTAGATGSSAAGTPVTAASQEAAAMRELLDDNYLPSAREQLQQCREDNERRKQAAAATATPTKTMITTATASVGSSAAAPNGDGASATMSPR